MALQFHTPPGWPAAPSGWQPDSTWRPDPSWPPAPAGWVFWSESPEPAAAIPGAATLTAKPSQTATPHGGPPPNPAPQKLRSRWWARLAWLPTLVFGVIAYLIVMQVMLATQNPNLFPTLLFVGAITVPTAVLMLVYGLGQRVGQDAVLVVITAVVGGIIGVISASQLEAMFVPSGPGANALSVAVAVAIIEETVKMFVPVAIFLLLRRRSPGLGVVIGIAAGAGFAVLETMGYGFTALLTTGGNISIVDQTLMLRALLAPASHVAWTGIVAAALWRTADVNKPYRWSMLIGAFITAIALHSAWDATDSTAVQFAIVVISLAALILAVVTGIRAQRQQPVLPRPSLVMAPIGAPPAAGATVAAPVPTPAFAPPPQRLAS